MKTSIFMAALLTGAALAISALAQDKAPPPLALTLPQTETKGMLNVTSATLGADGSIPLDTSSYGKSNSPKLTWTKGPTGTKSYVVFMEDTDATVAGKPISHWVAYNIPGDVTSLPEGLPKTATLDMPKGMLQGTNIAKAAGYFGPKPPQGGAGHHYHLEVFALDATLGLMPGAMRDEVIEAMNGHVKAKGEVVGLYTPPPK